MFRLQERVLFSSGMSHRTIFSLVSVPPFSVPFLHLSFFVVVVFQTEIAVGRSSDTPGNSHRADRLFICVCVCVDCVLNEFI